MFAVDSRFQIWLKQCRSATNCNEVNDNTIDFRPLISEVMFGNFHYNLPPTFKMKDPAAGTTTTTTATKPTDKDKDKDKEGKGRKKKKGDEDRTMLKNDSPHLELCMLANETWAINFASKHVDKRKG